ncbi:MAG: rpsA [Deltaproteobacteria bacterium]|nr:rpsA [Deltaproteobacteria bacterium]
MTEKEMNGEASFEELLKASSESPGRKLFPGDKVSGKVAKISKDTVFVDLGGKSEGIADIQEFLDKEGHLIVKQGDLVEMRVASIRDGIHLTKGMKVQGADALDMLREAKERGKNIVVSRRVLMEEEREKKSKETLARLKPDLECEGKVTKLTDFGAFVDVGGIEGMVHISEISHGRINHPSEILKPGQQVKVKVLKIESEKESRPKISLSLTDGIGALDLKKGRSSTAKSPGSLTSALLLRWRPAWTVWFTSLKSVTNTFPTLVNFLKKGKGWMCWSWE